MTDETYQFRYAFTVSQDFGQEPALDTFMELKTPDGLSKDHVDIMTGLHRSWMKDEIDHDLRGIYGMEMRLRFNSNMYQRVCIVKTNVPISRDELNRVILARHRIGKLKEFLDEAAI